MQIAAFGFNRSVGGAERHSNNKTPQVQIEIGLWAAYCFVQSYWFRGVAVRDQKSGKKFELDAGEEKVNLEAWN